MCNKLCSFELEMKYTRSPNSEFDSFEACDENVDDEYYLFFSFFVSVENVVHVNLYLRWKCHFFLFD